jgi:5-methylcytosine rRNA methyltransferase NSUN4
MATSNRRLPDSHLPFDAFFSAFFGRKQWTTIRQALQAPKKSCALLNRYSTFDASSLFPSDEFHRVDSLSTSNMKIMAPIDCTTCHDVPRPEQFSHYPMCASSLLPILALDIQPNDRVLDLCASPGGKSLAIVQQFDTSNRLTSNEMSQERYARLNQTLRSYLPSDIVQQQVRLTHVDATRQTRGWTTTFDKILVDAPCSSERHLVHSSSTHLWSVKRSKGNARRQLALLRTAMRAVKPDTGTIVYSTCSLSPYENDLVIEQCLQQYHGRIRIHRAQFPFGVATEYGWLVVPEPWGPFYVCVLHVRESMHTNIDEFLTWKTGPDSTTSDEEEEEEEEEKGA